MTTKNHLNAHILRSPWSEYPLPPLHRACRDGDMQSLIYLVTQGDRLEVFRSINEQDRFLLWTPAHWASYFGKVCVGSYRYLTVWLIYKPKQMTDLAWRSKFLFILIIVFANYEVKNLSEFTELQKELW